MELECDFVWREISNYLDDDIEPVLRPAIEQHIQGCKSCACLRDSTRNIVRLYRDPRMFDVPLGFEERLFQKIDEKVGWSY
jgi:predicted anti-sigma-YlaC factor YlaD